MKRIKNILTLLVIIAITIWAFIKINSLPSLTGLFTPKKLVIQNTPVVVKQIQALAQLVTVSMYEEIVVDSNASTVRTLQIPLLPGVHLSGEDKTLVIIGKVTTHIGIDLQKLSNTDISGTRDSINIMLPQADVLDAIINPSDVTVFIERGEWNNEAVNNLKKKAQYIAVSDAQSKGLFLQSENKARQILTDFFTAAGYKKVVIRFRKNHIRQQ